MQIVDMNKQIVDKNILIAQKESELRAACELDQRVKFAFE